MASKIAAVYFALNFICASALAQDCNAILQHGLRNIAIQQSDDASEATKYYNNCGTDYNNMSDAQLATVEVSVFGYGSGNAGYSRGQREERLKNWCTTNREFAMSHHQDYSQAQNIYAPAVAAWDTCNHLVSNSVQILPQINPSDRIVDVKIKYSGPGHDVKLQGIQVEHFQCAVTSNNANAQLPLTLGSDLVNVHCVRSAPEAVVQNQTQYSKWLEANIAIQTAGETLALYFPEKWDPSVPEAAAMKLRRDVETLRQSAPAGTVAAFVGVALPAGWLLCDGTTASRTKYPELWAAIKDTFGKGDGTTTFNLPDYQGQFLRGLDLAGKVDKDGPNRNLASAQQSQTGPHTHGTSGVITVFNGQAAQEVAATPGNGAYYWKTNTWDGSWVGRIVSMNDGGGTENRPTNFPVKWIIKY